MGIRTEANVQMFGLKAAFDPQGLLNPGKLIPTLNRCAGVRAGFYGRQSCCGDIGGLSPLSTQTSQCADWSKPDPGATATLKVSNLLPKLVQQAGGVQKRRAGFLVYLYLCFCAGCRPQSQAVSHFQDETVSRISRNIRFIPQVLRNTLS